MHPGKRNEGYANPPGRALLESALAWHPRRAGAKYGKLLRGVNRRNLTVPDAQTNRARSTADGTR